jgi:hypothetical protein
MKPPDGPHLRVLLLSKIRPPPPPAAPARRQFRARRAPPPCTPALKAGRKYTAAVRWGGGYDLVAGRHDGFVCRAARGGGGGLVLEGSCLTERVKDLLSNAPLRRPHAVCKKSLTKARPCLLVPPPLLLHKHVKVRLHNDQSAEFFRGEE